MKLTRNILFPGILLFGLTTILLVLFNIQLFYLRAIFSFIFLTTIPGLLIMLMLKIRKIEFWEYVVYTIGLSIAFLMFAGLAVNWVLPWLHITDKPLSLMPLLTSFDIILSIFGFIAYKRNKEISLKIKLPKVNRINKIFFATPIIFPILSTLGAITLNNGGPNYLTMVMLGGIAAYVFLIAILRNKLNEHVFPWVILLASVSLLLMYSLRSWHILGFDINQEYKTFELTKTIFYWSISNFKNAYNSCLSLTILPTIFSSFLNINDEFIFKLFYQIIFSFVPVAVFLLLKRYANLIVAFLSSFFFISQWQFMEQMSALARQEIALLFFTLFLIALFNSKFNQIIKNTILLIFGFSMIVSHYSTAYVALALFVFTYLIVLFLKKTDKKKYFSIIYKKLKLKEQENKLGKIHHHLNGFIVLSLIVFSVFWYTQITNISKDLLTVTYNTIQNMGTIFTQEMKSEGVKMVLFGGADIYTITDLQNYIQEATSDYHTNKSNLSYYSPKKYKEYKPEPIYPQYLSVANEIAEKILTTSTVIIKVLIKIFILVGVFYLLFTQIKKRKINMEYIIMVLGGVFLLGLIVYIPYISIEYNFERLYEQTLIILSLPTVMGGLIMFKFLKKENIKIILITLIFILYFLQYSGFTAQLVGGVSLVQLNNFGEDYDKFYTHESEVKSLGFISKISIKNDEIYMDRYANLKALAFSTISTYKTFTEILPSTIDRNAYVYSSYVNTIENRTFTNYGQKFISYTFPTDFISQNKNLIYNNGQSAIYK